MYQWVVFDGALYHVGDSVGHFAPVGFMPTELQAAPLTPLTAAFWSPVSHSPRKGGLSMAMLADFTVPLLSGHRH